MAEIITRSSLMRKIEASRASLKGRESIHKEPRVIKTILVEQHDLIRMALQHLVSTFAGVEIVAIFTSIEELYKHIQRVEADVIVLGISIASPDCLKFTEYTRSSNLSALEFVIIRLRLFPETVQTFVKDGIHGLLDEAASERDLADAIAAVSSGGLFLNKQARDILASSLSRAAIYLTTRELEVVTLLKKGVSNFRIAQTLCLKEKTVEAYLTRIYSKLGVNSRVEAIVSLANLDI